MTAHALVALHRRAVGTAALLLVALGGWRAVEAAAARRAARSPLAVGTLLSEPLRALLDSAGIANAAHPRPAVLLYVSDSCAHCQRELARWDSLASAGVLPLDAVAAIVVRLPPTDGVSHPLPHFPELTVLDPGGRIGRDLRVVVVPTTYWLDREARVRAVTRGQQSPGGILRRFHDLLRS
jgi:hypothetical protein